MRRHESRICAMKILYNLDFNISMKKNNNIVTIPYTYDEFMSDLLFVADPDYDLLENNDIIKELDDENFCKQLVFGVINKQNEIDDVINNNITNWNLTRLSFVDRAIIRIAVFEMLFTNTPHQIIIDEALEITKEYSNLDDDLQVKFTNRLLDSISGSMNKNE